MPRGGRRGRRQGAAPPSSRASGPAGSVASQGGAVVGADGSQAGAGQPVPRPGASAWVALTLATFSMAVGFAVWSLLAPLAPLFRQVRPDESTSTMVARFCSPTAPSSASHGRASPHFGGSAPIVGGKYVSRTSRGYASRLSSPSAQAQHVQYLLNRERYTADGASRTNR